MFSLSLSLKGRKGVLSWPGLEVRLRSSTRVTTGKLAHFYRLSAVSESRLLTVAILRLMQALGLGRVASGVLIYREVTAFWRILGNELAISAVGCPRLLWRTS